MKTLWSKNVGIFGRIASVTAALIFCSLAVLGQSSPPMMVQVPFVSLAAGGGTACTTGDLPAMGGSTTGVYTAADNYGDGCGPDNISVSAPWGSAVDAWGNVYFADSKHYEVRVIYAGPKTVNGVDTNPATAMIEGAYASGTTWGAWGSVTPAAGNVYSVGGGYTAAIASKNTDASYACNNVANGASPDALSQDGSGCPANYSYLSSPYNPAVDSEGNVFIPDKGNSAIYVIIANPGTTSAPSLAAQLVELENPSAFPSGCTATNCPTLPSVGYIYLIVGHGGSYSDGGLATSTSGEIHAPYGIAVDTSENLYIADYTNNAVRMVNGPSTTTTDASSVDCTVANGAPAAGTCGPGFIHTIAGVNCTATGCTAETGASGTTVSGQPAIDEAFVTPAGIAVDAYGNIYVGDNTSKASAPATVRVIYAGGTNNPAANLIDIEDAGSTLTRGDVYTIAGYAVGGSTAVGNGSLATASTVGLDRPYGLALDSHGNIYIADYNGNTDMSIAEVNASTGYLYFIAGGSVATLGNTNPCSGTTGVGPTMTDSYGDGCPATQGSMHDIEGNPSFDSAGNMYVADSSDNLIRKLTFSSFPAATVGSAAAMQSLAFSLLTGNSSEAASGVTTSVVTQGTANNEFVDPGTGDTCTSSATLTGFANNKTTQGNSTCVLPITFTPAYAGARSGAVEISGSLDGGSTTGLLGTAYLSGTGNGAALVIDPSAATSIGADTGTTPQGVATDAGGNTYIAWANGDVSSTPGGTLATPIIGQTSDPHQIALDGAGNVYVADTGNNRIAEFAAGASTPTAIVSGLAAPQGIAVDASGNMYIADTGNKRVVMQPIGNGALTVLGNGFTFTTPVAVAVDGSGNVYVADSGSGSGTGEIVEIPAGNGTAKVVSDSGISPVSLAVDAAGDIDYLDSSSSEVMEIPASGGASDESEIVTGLAAFTAPASVALDMNGGVYVADDASAGVSYYSRTLSAQNFASTSDTVSATLTNIGNQSYSQTFTESDSSDFTVSGSASNGCTYTSPLALAPGANCGLTALFTPGASGPLTDTIVFGSGPKLTLTGTATGTVVATTTSLGSLSPALPTYGDTATVTVTVSPASGSTAPTGTVSFVVDGGTASESYALSASGSTGTYTYTLPALGAGDHTVAATYTPTGNFTASTTTTPLSITVAQLAITATVTTTTSVAVVYGQAIPTINGTLNGVLSGDAANVSPVFTTTATAGSPVSGSPYPVSVSLSGSAAGNYTVTLNGTPTVVIGQATISVTVNSTSKVYGNANPSFTSTPTGVYSPDSAYVVPVYSTTATQYSPVNGATGYPITVTGLTLTGSAVGNYKLGTVTNGTLTITPLAISASIASPVDVTYGSAIPALSGTLTGVVNNDNVAVALTTTAAQGNGVGDYPITLAATPLTGTAAGNYTVTLSGSPVVAITQLAITAAPTPVTVVYGEAIPALTGTLSSNVLSADIGNVTPVFTTTAVVGDNAGTSYPITLASPALTGSAAGNYSVTLNGTASVTISQASTATTLTEQASGVGIGSAASFTVTVAAVAPGAGMPTGSVTFSSGSMTGTVALSGGTATWSTDYLPAGEQSVTATYEGSTDFAASTSNTVTENVTQPVVTGTPSGSSTVTIAGGSSGTITLDITAQGGYTGIATYGCAFLPANMTCSFNPATSTFTSTDTTATTVLTISTNGSSTATAMLSRQANPSRGRWISPVLAAGILLPGALLGLVGFGKRRRQWQRRVMLLVLLAAGMAGMATMSGCGGSSSTHNTAAGTYSIQVDITAGTMQTVPLTVVVQ